MTDQGVPRLVAEVRNEHSIGLERLEPLRPGLRFLALHSLGSEDAAEEAVQETLARAVVALHQGQPADLAKLPAFVAGIARHVIVDMLRARRRVVPLDVLPLSEHPTAPADALAGLVSAAERERVRAALLELSPADRELLRLCYFEGLTPAEVAVRLGEPPDRVRKRKSRALERLRQAFHGALGHAGNSAATRD
jgi:RNA polymerase sigma-70 factor, ECF subfamily